MCQRRVLLARILTTTGGEVRQVQLTVLQGLT
jgi:hypothetical protein